VVLGYDQPSVLNDVIMSVFPRDKLTRNPGVADKPRDAFAQMQWRG